MQECISKSSSIFWCAKTHVACQGLNENGITLARLYRRYVSTGAVYPGTTIVIDEISLLSTRDFEVVVLPLARLGCQMILLGDPQTQLLAIQDTCFDKDLSRDISDSDMLKSAVGNKRLVLTECRRSDRILFDWYCSISSATSLEDLLQSTDRFPPEGQS